MPNMTERGWPSHVASTLIHAFAILLLFLPSLRSLDLQVDEEGAGGAGPAGGGGGGTRGTGGVRSEHVQYVAQQAAAPIPVPEPPRIIPPLVEKKPEVVPPPTPTPPVDAAKADSSNKAAEASAATVGTGGGSGNDGTAGSGPGKGGGVGSGEGTGRGSGIGPGTGGGFGTVYPPTVTQLVILPLPAPSKVKPYELVAWFDVDSLGRATLLTWNEPKDKGYRDKVYTSLQGYRFRPAVTWDGRPVRDTVAIRASVGK
jgi:protein TonB